MSYMEKFFFIGIHLRKIVSIKVKKIREKGKKKKKRRRYYMSSELSIVKEEHFSSFNIVHGI